MAITREQEVLAALTWPPAARGSQPTTLPPKLDSCTSWGTAAPPGAVVRIVKALAHPVIGNTAAREADT